VEFMCNYQASQCGRKHAYVFSIVMTALYLVYSYIHSFEITKTIHLMCIFSGMHFASSLFASFYLFTELVFGSCNALVLCRWSIRTAR